MTKLRKYYVTVCLFFIFSCLANGKHCTGNHATKVTKIPKTKLPKYVRGIQLETKTLFTNNSEIIFENIVIIKTVSILLKRAHI